MGLDEGSLPGDRVGLSADIGTYEGRCVCKRAFGSAVTGSSAGNDVGISEGSSVGSVVENLGTPVVGPAVGMCVGTDVGFAVGTHVFWHGRCCVSSAQVSPPNSGASIINLIRLETPGNVQSPSHTPQAAHALARQSCRSHSNVSSSENAKNTVTANGWCRINILVVRG